MYNQSTYSWFRVCIYIYIVVILSLKVNGQKHNLVMHSRGCHRGKCSHLSHKPVQENLRHSSYDSSASTPTQHSMQVSILLNPSMSINYINVTGHLLAICIASSQFIARLQLSFRYVSGKNEMSDGCCFSYHFNLSDWCGLPFGLMCCYNFLLRLSFLLK